MLAYIFIVEGVGKIAGYAGVTDYMQAHGVDGRLLPLVILTELGGGLLVLFGLKTRWAAIALSGYCLLTALLFHLSADQTIHFSKNVAMAGGFLTLAIRGPGPMVARRLARSRRLGSPDSITVPGQPDRAADFTPKPGRSLRQQLAKPSLMRMIDRLGSFDPCATPSANDRCLRKRDSVSGVAGVGVKLRSRRPTSKGSASSART
jgi:putative oxidoreductase